MCFFLMPRWSYLGFDLIEVSKMDGGKKVNVWKIKKKIK